ncbi:MAG: hypothetical protein ACYCYL_01360 [Acidithiobacillus sp.]
MHLQQCMQGTPGAPDETFALDILVGARGLADHQDAAGPSELWQVWFHDFGAGSAEGATFLAGHLGFLYAFPTLKTDHPGMMRNIHPKPAQHGL